MGRTKKVKGAGRFGVRYGTKIRHRINSAETEKGRFACPSCAKKAVRRVSSGIWECRRCGLKFAGKAYKPG
jgi:large subunit ribosomal protein L37Ae